MLFSESTHLPSVRGCPFRRQLRQSAVVWRRRDPSEIINRGRHWTHKVLCKADGLLTLVASRGVDRCDHAPGVGGGTSKPAQWAAPLPSVVRAHTRNGRGARENTNISGNFRSSISSAYQPRATFAGSVARDRAVIEKPWRRSVAGSFRLPPSSQAPVRLASSQRK
jgi:hypothetical protein